MASKKSTTPSKTSISIQYTPTKKKKKEKKKKKKKRECSLHYLYIKDKVHEAL